MTEKVPILPHVFQVYVMKARPNTIYMFLSYLLVLSFNLKVLLNYFSAVVRLQPNDAPSLDKVLTYPGI